MERYQVSRDTVRKALGMLENQGYIQKARGKVATVSGRRSTICSESGRSRGNG